MATFAPGHLHIERHALHDGDYSYNLCIDYEVSQDPKGRPRACCSSCTARCRVRTSTKSSILPKDQAFDFARHAMNIAQKYGMPKIATLNGEMHKQYDSMFEDVRHQLNVKPGDPVKPEHLA